MKISGLLVLGIIGFLSAVFMLFSIGFFSNFSFTSLATGSCPAFSTDTDVSFYLYVRNTTHL